MKKILFEHPWKSAFLPYVVISIIFIFSFILPRGPVFDDIEFILLLIVLILIILFPIRLICGLIISKKKLPYILSILISLLILITTIYVIYLFITSDQGKILHCVIHPWHC